MTTPITLKDITIHPVIEQPRCTDFRVMEFFPALTKELLDENRSWLEPAFIDPVNNGLVLCIQGFVIKTLHHNILIDFLRRQSQATSGAAVLAHDEQRPVRKGACGCRPRRRRHRLCDVHAFAWRPRRLEHPPR